MVPRSNDILCGPERHLTDHSGSCEHAQTGFQTINGDKHSMAIFDLFSKRQKRLRGEVPDVYQYEKLPAELRAQIFHIWGDCFGDRGKERDHAFETFKSMHLILCREYGLFNLKKNAITGREAMEYFLLTNEDTEKVLDVIELSFRVIDRSVRGREWEYRDERFP